MRRRCTRIVITAVDGAKAGFWMRRLLVGSLAIPLLLLAAPGQAPAAARSAKLHTCKELRVGTLRVYGVRANYPCSRARPALRRLLRNGVGALPARKSSRRKWACGRHGSFRVCTRPASRKAAPTRRIRFRTATTKPAPPPPPPPTITPPPQDCLDLWNGDPMALNDGLHFYTDHNVRKAWVFHTSDGRCAVVAAVPSDDPYPAEYGTDGDVTKPSGGWIYINSFTWQDQAPAHANVSLAPDGKIAPL